MIEFNDVSVRRDGRVLFKDVSFQLHPKQKVGLIGNNGTGKSSFFAVLLGELGVDTGEVSMPPNWQIAHMAQEVPASDELAMDYVLAGDKEWYELNAKLLAQSELAQSELDGKQIAKLHQRFDEIDGYRIPAKAAQILAGLGFATHQYDHAVKAFSGGWRMRLNLARTLMSRADLLLLDEPTNHLDLDAILWLEEWIAGFDGLVLLISHDQSFLDACVGHILHIEYQQMILYTGNYSQFVRTRSERLSQQQQAYEKQQATRAHLENFIRRFKAKASKAKQAQSRIKQLERMSKIAPVMADNPFTFAFYEPAQLTSPLIVMDNASVGYDGVPLIQNIRLQITPDSRIGLLGMNGAGKSTVIKGLVGELPLLPNDLLPNDLSSNHKGMVGTRTVADSLALGYFNQHQMDALDSEATPMLMLQRLAGNTSDADLRAFLGSFDFRGERIDTPIKLFSGGERARLTLALIVWQRPNVLVLDEPTNHLDLQMRQALSFALQNFSGAVILVSHDREMMATVCDELYLVHDGRCEVFDDDIASYGVWLSQVRKEQSKTPHHGACETIKKSEQANLSVSKEEQRKKSAEQRKLTAPIRQRIETAENGIEVLDKQLADLENKLSNTELYDDSRKAELLTLLDKQKQLQRQHSEQEEALLMAMTELEEMESGFE